ncbi:hypothetical protein, partial [Vibrio sp. 10N.261.52.A1]|uniref:hypothetical protein n=1 Tax=Vibrio sp. 10N.261.52.A1 TaxID=1880849 RepID=UPI001F530AD9
LQRVAGVIWKDEALICRLFVREVDNVVVNNQQTLPKGFELGAPEKSVFLFVEGDLLKMTRLRLPRRD